MCEKIRCSWAGDLQIYVEYHDQEWGRPVHEDNKLFEMLILEGMQAGLSWITVLKKRKAFREAFDCFDPFKVSLYDEEKIQELLANEGIIRNRLKVAAAATPLSDKISKDLKKIGFKFVGSTIVYAFMQATGMVNDHVTNCFVYQELDR